MPEDVFSKKGWIYLLIPTWIYLGFYERNFMLMIITFVLVGMFHFQVQNTIKQGIKNAKEQYKNSFQEMKEDEKNLVEPALKAIDSDWKIIVISGLCMIAAIYSLFLLWTNHAEDFVGFTNFWILLLAFLYKPIKGIQLGFFSKFKFQK